MLQVSCVFPVSVVKTRVTRPDRMKLQEDPTLMAEKTVTGWPKI